MASVVSILQTWLSGYSGLTVTPATDMMKADIEAAGLFRSPDNTRITFVDGSADISEYYLFTCRRSAMTDSERQDNEEWMEGLARWITQKWRAGDLPELGNNRVCWAVHPSGSFSMPSETDTDAVWQQAIEIRYYENNGSV